MKKRILIICIVSVVGFMVLHPLIYKETKRQTCSFEGNSFEAIAKKMIAVEYGILPKHELEGITTEDFWNNDLDGFMKIFPYYDILSIDGSYDEFPYEGNSYSVHVTIEDIHRRYYQDITFVETQSGNYLISYMGDDI
jgi:hypothetical protein